MRDGVKQLVAAVAVAERETERGIRSMVDELVCLNPQNNLFTVKSHYHSFPRVSDEEIMRILSNNEEFLVCREGDIDMINDELVEFFGYMSREAQIP